MRLNALQRIVVLLILVAGLLAPSLTAAAAPAPLTSRQQAYALIDQLLAGTADANDLLAAQSNRKKLPREDRETPTPEDEEDTPVDEGDSGSTSDALIGVLGGERADFEDEFGPSADDADADDFAYGEVYEGIRGYDTISVFWEDDVALHIQLNANKGWSESRALTLAEQFLPADVELDSDPVELDEGELLYAGSSEALGEVVGRSTYRDYEVGGRPGDLRVILVPGDDDTFMTVDIAIGAGDEYAGGSGTTVEPTAEPTKKPRKSTRATEEPVESSGGDLDADEYLTSVREQVDKQSTQLDRFYEILGLGSDATDADFTELTDILIDWMLLPELEAPEGYEEIDDAYTSLSKNLSDASLNLTTFLAAGANGDQSLLDDARAQLQTASTLLADLDDLLSAEGY